MKTIATNELSEMLSSGDVAVFDVRGDVEYEEAHIPGAKTAPMGSLVFRVVDLMNPDSLVVLYSGGGDCPMAGQAATRLENMGMRNVGVFEAGIEGWVGSGRSLVASPDARVHARGPVQDVRHIVVDRENAYGGAFLGEPTEVGGAGG